MTKTRKNFTAVKKAVIVREYLEGGYSLSAICEKYQVHPSMVGRWKKRLFEGAIETFNREQSRNQKKEERQVKELRQKLARKDEVIAELIEDNLKLKKNTGEI